MNDRPNRPSAAPRGLRAGLARAIACGALAALSAAAPTAVAAIGSTDYVVTTPTGLWEPPPSGASSLTFTNQQATRSVDLPFEFVYFGAAYRSVWVSRTGYLQFGATDGAAQPSPQDLSRIGSASECDGVCAPMWGNMYPNGPSARCSWVVTGEAPNRRFVATWEEYGNYNTPSGWASFQVRLHEGTNRVEFVYKPDSVPSKFTGIKYSCGMDAFGADTRWVAPYISTADNTTLPPTDYRFDPRLVDVSGRATFDRLVPTADGLTGPSEEDLAGLAVEVRGSGGRAIARGYVGADGSLDVPVPVPPGAVQVVVSTRTRAVSVFDPDATLRLPFEWQLASVSGLTADRDLGTVRVTSALDAGAAFRGPANVARAMDSARAWAVARLPAATLPSVDVHWSATSSAATSFEIPSGTTPCTIRVGGPSAANPDTWDDDVVRRLYGRALLGAVAAYPPFASAIDFRFDARTSPENAFAEAFGIYVAAAVSRRGTFVDATSPNSADSFDLEDPRPSSPRGTDVTAWVAAALYDLLDPANEPHDRCDGTVAGADGEALRVADGIAGVPTVDSFFEAWARSGTDASAVSRILVGTGLLADDAFEANDDATESRDLGETPLRRTSLVLNPGNDDWFRITLPAASAGLVLEMDFARSQNPATVLVELRNLAGAVLASKLDASLSPVALATGPLAAGTYRVRVHHDTGKIVPDYTLQAADRLVFGNQPFPAWTVGRAFSYDLPVRGGHPPYSFQVVPSTGAPPGVGFVAATARAAGTPSAAGTYSFALVVRDAGTPSHEVTSTIHAVVNPEVALGLGEFVAVPSGRAFNVTRGFGGGTAPFTFSVLAGALPPGLSLDGAELRFTGSGVEPGAAAVRIGVSDAAGDEDARDVHVVATTRVAGTATEAALGGGDAACGWWFDAVAGSTVSVQVATVRKQPKRALRVVVAGPGGAAPPAKLKGGNGRASVASLVCPESGRYHVVVASESGEPTTLTATVRTRAPSKSKAKVPEFGPGTTVDVEVGVLAGADVRLAGAVSRKSGTALLVQFVFAPDGTAFDLTGRTTSKDGKATFAAELPVGGTWIVRLVGVGGEGAPLAWSWSARQPKGVAYDAGDDE